VGVSGRLLVLLAPFLSLPLFRTFLERQELVAALATFTCPTVRENLQQASLLACIYDEHINYHFL